jgi:hypothetical protein
MTGVRRTALRLALSARRAARFRSWVLSIALVFGCGANGAPLSPRSMPPDARARRSSLSELGKMLFEGLRGGELRGCFANQDELEALVAPEAHFRLERDRAASVEHVGAADNFQRDWALAGYAGFCAQGAREEAAGSSLGLTRPGWVVDRILVVADLGAGRPRSASWLEGAFVYTGRGWKALSFRRIETPRLHHADLELAPCDVESGLR